MPSRDFLRFTAKKSKCRPWIFAHVSNVSLPSLLRMIFVLFCLFCWKCGIPKDPNIPKNTKTQISGGKKHTWYTNNTRIKHVRKAFRVYQSKTAWTLDWRNFGFYALNQLAFIGFCAMLFRVFARDSVWFWIILLVILGVPCILVWFYVIWRDFGVNLCHHIRSTEVCFFVGMSFLLGCAILRGCVL